MTTLPNPFTRIAGSDPVPEFAPDAYHKIGSSIDLAALRNGDTTGFTMSRSTLWDFSKSPSKWIRGAKKEVTEAMKGGSLLDARLLTPTHFVKTFVPRPPTYPAEAKKGEVVQKPWNLNAGHCKDWEEKVAAEGKTAYWPEDLAEAEAAIARLQEEQAIVDLIGASARSVFFAVRYTDPATGISFPVKALIDLFPEGGSIAFGNIVVDLKRTTNGAFTPWVRKVFDQGYHYQGAMYLDIVNAATDGFRSSFGHLVVEDSPPFEPALYALSSEYLAMGRRQYQRDLALFCQCLATKKWPGYASQDAARLKHNGWLIAEPTTFMVSASDFNGFSGPQISRPASNPAPGLSEDDIIP